jgi:gamma-butyrobetaine dioxygenase
MGAGLVRNASLNFAEESCAPVAVVGRLLAGSLSHGALYGDTFHVKSVPNAKNIAYTSVPLSPHQDLAYYESKPGLQFLHCISNENVEGGESVLIDAMAAAEEFRRIAPMHFEILTKCSATFVKQREGADMIYRRPHIVVDDLDNIVSVNWSPPFEGPLCLQPDSMVDYYRAYAALERMLDNSLPKDHDDYALPPKLANLLSQYANKYTWERRLEAGEMLVFSNLRMLHGRRGFSFCGDDGGGRHLMGAYTNIDDTLNRYRVLLRDRCSGVSVPSAGNGSCGVS